MQRYFAPTHPMQLALGLTLWCVWFVAVYGGVSLACMWQEPVAPAWQPVGALAAINAGLLMLSGLTIALLAWWMWRCAKAAGAPEAPGTGPRASRFIAFTAAALHGSALLAVVFVAIPLWSLPPCP